MFSIGVLLALAVALAIAVEILVLEGTGAVEVVEIVGVVEITATGAAPALLAKVAGSLPGEADAYATGEGE